VASPTSPTDWRNLPPVPEDRQPRVPEVPSQTFLQLHDACDRNAYLFLRYRGGAGAHELNRGALGHDVFDRLLRILVASHRRAGDVSTAGADYQPSPEEVENQAMQKVPPELGRDVLIEVMRERPELQVPAKERDALRYMVDHWCRGNVFDKPILGIEQTLTLQVGPYRVMARADLIEDGGNRVCEITDWKTSFPPTYDEFVKQVYDDEGNPYWAGNFQLNMLAVLAAFGVTDDGMPLGNFDRYKLTLAFPRELRADGIVRRSIEVTLPQLATFREDLELQIARLVEVNVGERRWQPTPGNHCRYCTAPNACPLPPILRPESQLADPDNVTIDDLERMAANSNFMSTRATKLKSRIRTAAERLEEENPGALDLGNGDRGVRIGRDLAFIFVPREGEEVIDKAALADAMEAAEHGAPFVRSDHFRVTEGTSFEKRKVRLPARTTEPEPELENGGTDGS
jgi:hypothetical protein